MPTPIPSGSPTPDDPAGYPAAAAADRLASAGVDAVLIQHEFGIYERGIIADTHDPEILDDRGELKHRFLVLDAQQARFVKTLPGSVDVASGRAEPADEQRATLTAMQAELTELAVQIHRYPFPAARPGALTGRSPDPWIHAPEGAHLARRLAKICSQRCRHSRSAWVWFLS